MLLSRPSIRLQLFMACCACAISSASLWADAFRTFTSHDGRSIDAKLHGYDRQGRLTLELSDGRIIRDASIEYFSEPDKRYLEGVMRNTPPRGYPPFSWDRVPLYAHAGLGAGLKPEEYRFIAEHYDFITFTGGSLGREYRADPELHFEGVFQQAVQAIKQYNPKATVLYYWAGDLEKPHNKLANAARPAAARIKVERNASSTVQVYDTRKAEVREWWSDVAAKAVHTYGADGIFVDGGTAFTPGSIYEHKLGKATNDALEQGMFAMLRQAKEKMGEDAILFLNPLHAPKPGQAFEEALGLRYMPVFDGAMIDDFDRAANLERARQTKEYICSTIQMMRNAAKAGEIVVFKAWPGFTWWSDKELMKQPHAQQYKVAVQHLDFPLACFLIGAETYCYFCYTWGWLPKYGTLDWYPEFDKPLGPPMGDAVQDGWTFSREFKHASVFVDVEQRLGRIDWKSQP